MDEQNFKLCVRDVLGKLTRARRMLSHPDPAPDMPLVLSDLLDDVASQLKSAAGIRTYPDPTTPRPDFETLEDWMFDGGCEATDGCVVEPDGWCEHNYPSWLRYLGLV